MKIKKIVFIIIVFLIFLFGISYSQDFDIRIKKVLSKPSSEAELVYEIPIDVRILSVSDDGNWYKVRIEFDLVFLGRYEYVGWVNAPIGEYLKKRLCSKEVESEIK